MSPSEEILGMRRDIEDARKRFRGKCRMILRQAYEEADNISTAIGEISEYQAFDAWVRRLFELIGQSGHASSVDEKESDAPRSSE